SLWALSRLPLHPEWHAETSSSRRARWRLPPFPAIVATTVRRYVVCRRPDPSRIAVQEKEQRTMTSALRCLLAALLGFVMPVAQAATYPDRPVRFIVPYPPGGNADLMARLVGQKLGEYTGQNFVLDNRGG